MFIRSSEKPNKDALMGYGYPRLAKHVNCPPPAQAMPPQRADIGFGTREEGDKNGRSTTSPTT